MKDLLATLRSHAQTQPDRRAFVFARRRAPAVELTWREAVDRIEALAADLAGRGIRAREVISIIASTPEEQVLAFLGCIALGAVPTLLSYPSIKQPPAKFLATFGAIARAGGTHWLLASQGLADEADRWVQHERLHVRVVSLGDVSIVPFADVGANLRIAALPRDAPLFLQYSSGTTGIRKGLAVSSIMLWEQARAYAAAIELRSTDTVASWLPLYHDMGLLACLLIPIMSGAATIHLSPFEWIQRPTEIFELFARYEATACWMPNFAFNLLARTPLPSLSPRFFESIRLLVNSGEPLRSASIEAFLAAFEPRGLRRSAMQTSYGMAENTFAVTQSLLGEGPITLRVDRDALLVGGRVVVAPDAAERSLVLVSSGRVLPAHRIRIANASNYGQVGEIEIKSGCLFSGYLADPAATKTAFTEDGWYRTGDLGFSWGGHLFVTGRKSDLVIVNGVNIYPSDVEDIAGAVAGVKPGRIVAFGVESAYSGSEQLVVLAEPTEDGLMDVVAQRIREEVYAVLSVVVHDVEIVPRGTLAKSTSGKLSRAANRTFYLNARAGADAAAAAAARGRR